MAVLYTTKRVDEEKNNDKPNTDTDSDSDADTEVISSDTDGDVGGGGSDIDEKDNDTDYTDDDTITYNTSIPTRIQIQYGDRTLTAIDNLSMEDYNTLCQSLNKPLQKKDCCINNNTEKCIYCLFDNIHAVVTRIDMTLYPITCNEHIIRDIIEYNRMYV